MQKNQTNDFFIACKESRIEKNTSFYGCFFLGPFDDSLSQTLANDLRRTLLSELTGLAITSIEIEGVLHKFSILPGMKESVLDLICNLQNIVLKKSVIPLFKSTTTTKVFKKTFIGFLNVNGPRVIKAKDLKLPAGLQCVDPNQYIATLAEDGVLNMKFNINEGKNFIKQKQYNLDVNVLKKRNILLQKVKQQTTGFPNIKRKTLTHNNNQFLPTTKKFNKYTINEKGSNGPLFKSVPIPLDAVFMPVSKINCLIEENNLFSDFSTDYSNISNNKSNLNLGITPFIYQSALYFKRDNLNLEIKKSLKNLDYNMIYQTCFVSKKKASNMVRLQEASSLALSSQVNNNLKFVPFVNDSNLNSINWPNASNLLYFKVDNTTAPNGTKEFTGPLQNILFGFIPSNPEGASFNSSRQIALKSEINPSLLDVTKTDLEKNKEMPETYNIKNFSKIKTFLITKNMKKDAFLPNGEMGQKNFVKNPGPGPGVSSVKNAPNFNYLALINQDKGPLDYTNLLKLKPLRKKSHVILEIWTNGSIHPRQALLQSCRFLTNNFLKLQTVKMLGSRFRSELAYANLKYSLLNNYLSQLALLKKDIFTETNVTSQLTKIKKIADKKFEQSLTNLKAPISILNISLRSYTILKKSGIFTLNDLIMYSKKDLLQKQNFGVKSLDEIETSLSILGLRLKN